jgi:hypothetical protein
VDARKASTRPARMAIQLLSNLLLARVITDDPFMRILPCTGTGLCHRRN